MAVDEDAAPDFALLYRAVAAFEDAGEEYERIVRRVYEAVLTDGDVAVDVGAHVGKHAVPMALACGPNGRVLAVEPIDWAIARLRDRVEHAGLGGTVTTYYGCCGDAEGSVSFTVVPNHPGWSSMAPRAEVTESVVVTVPQTTVDTLCAGEGRVRFMKVDVEGAEPLVLRGATGTLQRFLPVVHVEVIGTALDPFGFSPDDAIAPLLELGYRIYDLLGIEVTDPAVWAASSTVPEVADYVAIHPDDPAREAALAVLRSSFLAERQDRSSAPPGLQPSPGQAGGPSPLPWPAVTGPHHDGLVLQPGSPSLLCSWSGTLLPLSAPAHVHLPLPAATGEVPEAGTLTIDLTPARVPADRNVTVAELAWAGSATTLVRLHRDGNLEVLWLDGDRVLRADRLTAAGRPERFTVRVVRHRGRVRVDAVAGNTQVGSEAPGSPGPGPRFALTVGGRGDVRFQNEALGSVCRLAVVTGRLPLRERLEQLRRSGAARWRRLQGRAGWPRTQRSRNVGQKGPVG